MIAQGAFADTIFKDKRANPEWQKKSQDVFVITNAMYDVFVKVDDKVLSNYSSKYNIKKGFTDLVDRKAIHSLIKDFVVDKQMAGGGSVNTAAGIVNLGGAAALACVVSLDNFGKKFYSSVIQEGILPMVKFKKRGQTGVVLVFITPDLTFRSKEKIKLQ